MWINTAFKALTGIGEQPIASSPSRDGTRVKPGHFEHYVRRAIADGTASRSHDAGHADHSSGVGNHRDIGGQGHFAAVEQRESLGVARAAHLQTTSQLLKVIGVQRLTEFQHHKIGHIDNRADGAQT